MNFDLDFSSTQLLYILLVLHSTVGATGAIIAWHKGRNLGLWMVLGVTCGIAVFLVSLLLKPLPETTS